MSKTNSLTNRLIALALSVVMVLGMLPTSIVSAESAELYGNVTTYTGGTVTGDGTADVQVLVEETTLQWVAANELRAEGWWVGIDVIAPDGFSADATYMSKSNPNAEYGAAKRFADYKDGEKDIQLWFPVSPESLTSFAAQGRNLTLVYAFDWDADGTYGQTITFSVKPSQKIVLKKGEATAYPLATVTTYTGGTVSGNGSTDVQVLVEETTLQWVAANELRAEGWWVGIDVVAPEGFSADATYKSKSNPTAEYGEAKRFADYKDGEKDIQLWFPVSPESLQKFASEGRNLTLVYAFDWDANGVYEQTIAFSVKPSEKIVLKKGEATVYPLGLVSTYTGGTVTGNGTANVQVLVQNTTLDWVAGNELRAEGWWVGIDVVAPEGFSADATYKSKSNPAAEYGEAKRFADYKDGEKDIQLWFPVSAESLQKFASEGRNLTMTYAFDWDANGEYEQTIAFSVDPTGRIILKKDGERVYPGYGLVSTFTGGTVTGNGTADVQVVVDDTTLEWVEANSLRAEGWWVGIDVEAPEGYSAQASYKVKSNPSAAYGEKKLFKDYKDGENDIQLWFQVSPESLQKFASEGRNLTMTYTFDWDGDGEYEQTVAFSVDPTGRIVLQKNGERVYPGFGTVTAYQNAEITGNGTADVQVKVEETTLQWVEGNELRAEGWWVGIDMVAPNGFTADATYKVKSNPAAEYGEAKRFADYKDGANDIQLWFPVSVENLNKFIAEGRNLTMTYTFDWDGDGEYEQTVAFSVVPSAKIVLMKNDVQHYPQLGDVSAYHAATITGNKTGQVAVLIDDVTLDWVAADPSIGRTQGWWVGIDVVAPEGFSADATYKSKTNPTAEYGEPKRFADYKDGEKDIQLWMPLSQASLDKFKEEKRNLTLVYAFDWDADGDYEQEITFSVDPAGNVVLNKKAQSQITFATEAPADLWVGDTYQNLATGGNTENDFIYEIVEGPGQVDENGVVSFTGLGMVTVKATRPGNEYYEDASATYQITAVRKLWSPFTFQVSNPKITYAPGLTYPNASNENALAEATGSVTYSIVEGADVATIDAATGVLTILKAGTVVVQATRAQDDQYDVTTAQYTLTVDQAAQQVSFQEGTPTQLTWQEETINALELVKQSTGAITWDISAGKDQVASIDENGNLTLLKAGTFTVTAKVAEDECYLESDVVSFTIEVLHAQQAPISFATDSDTITYNDFDKNVSEGTGARNQYTLSISGGSSTGGVTYQVVEGDAVQIDGNIATIIKSGTVTIMATKAGDEQYNSVDSQLLTLTVNKADQSFTFDNSVEAKEVYGIREYATLLQKSALNSGKVSYAASQNDIGATVNADGLVTFADSEGKVGTVVITVTLEEDDCYNEFKKSYTITLRYADAPETAYELRGDKLVEGGEWFTGLVTIEAPNGYQIAYHNQLDGTWNNRVQWGEQEGNIGGDGCADTWKGTDNAPVIYLKNITTGEITDGIFVADLKRDTQLPTDLQITYETDFAETIFEKLFGFHATEVEVTVGAQDAMSGIAKLEYSLAGGAEGTYVALEEGVYTFTAPVQHRGQIAVRATDVAGNVQTYKKVTLEDVDMILVVDDTAPGLSVGYSGTLDDQAEDGIRYVKGEAGVTVVMEAIDEHYDLREADPTVTVTRNGEAYDYQSAWTVLESGNGQLVFTLVEEGDYILTASFTDRLDRVVTYTSEIRIDRTAPVIHPVTYSGTETNTNEGRLYFDAAQVVTLVIDEHNFDPNKVVLTITANDEAQTAADYIKTDWTSEGDLHTLVLDFPQDANYTLDVACKDVLDIEAVDYTEDLFTVDTVNPQNLSISYQSDVDTMWPDFLEELFGFGKDTVIVTITAEDTTAGIMELRYDIGNGEVIVEQGTPGFENNTYSFEIPAQYEGQVNLVAVDYAQRETECKDGKTVIVDSIAPEMSITYDVTNRKDQVKEDTGVIDRQTMAAADETTRFIYSGAFSATLRVEETHFYGERVQISVTRDGVAYTDFAATDWTEVTEEENTYWDKTLTMSEDGDYEITVIYSDESTNDMNWTAGEYVHTGTRTYVSNLHTIDTTPAQVTLTYTDKDDEVVHTNYHSDDRTATITVQDRNFRPNEIDLQIVAKDINGQNVEAFDYASLQLTQWSAWSAAANDTWTTNVQIPFAIDANYQVTLDYKDIAQNAAEIAAFEQTFTVDHEGPKDLSIVYSQHVLDKIMETITFGYYEAPMTVTLTATDLIAGMDYFTVSAKAEGPLTALNVELPEQLKIYVADKKFEGEAGFLTQDAVTVTNENGTVSMVFEIPAQFRGTFEFAATDMGHMTSNTAEPHIQVVDTTVPERTVTYEPTAIIDNKTLLNLETFAEGDDVSLYYNKDAVIAIEIQEANFYSENVHVYVNDEEVALDAQWAQVAGKADSFWSNTLTLTEEGDYIVVIEQTDYSGNKMATYTSQRIVIDKTAPIVEVEYHNNDVKNIFGERAYFDAHQSATVTITDHNFRADDVQILVVAKDVQGNNVLQTIEGSDLVKSYADRGVDRTAWTPAVVGIERAEDDTYKLELSYSADANYTFDIVYKDLANNDAVYTDIAQKDYEADQFTVDVTNPENLNVSYQTSFFEEILESITFGYYNAQMTVTISAEDATSGIYRFSYSYINSQGVSEVNKQLLDEAINEAEIDYSDDNKKATASFKVPKLVIENDNQFNGTVSFTAFDRSERTTEQHETKRVIVDTIKPNATISYNAPVQKDNNISYYDGNINATILINEANFDAEDVKISVTKNGANYPVKVKWVDNSVDVHTGTFTLTADGDYIVSVSYKDKSGNAMTGSGSQGGVYTSNQLTLDTIKPVIKVSNIKQNSANKDETYGFVIRVEDTNLDASTLKPVLKAVLKNEQGGFEMMEIDLGNATTVTKGQIYTYTVENLPEDGLYTLTCQVKDMSENAMNQILLEDEETYNQVQFSINRNGSAFGYGDSFLENLVKQYYVYSVEQDVVIVEVNADPIEDYLVSVNGNPLVEGTDFTTTQTSKEGEWSKRIYTINKSRFAEEGEYSVIVSSTDKAETAAFSDVKNLSVDFVVDQTKPVLTITGLEAGGRYQTEAQEVTLIPTDEGGRLASLKVIVLDSDGNPLVDKETGKDISVCFNREGEDLLNYLAENDGMVHLVIPQGLNNQVQIVCTDCASDADAQPNEYNELFQKVTVSPNGFVIFYANTGAFIGTIAGVLAAVLLVIFLIKRKKSKAEAKA